MRIWNNRTSAHELLGEINCEGGTIDVFADHVAVGDDWGNVIIRDLPDGSYKQLITPIDEPVWISIPMRIPYTSITLLATTIITASTKFLHELKVWDRSSGECMKTLERVTAVCVNEGLIYCAVLHPTELVTTIQTWIRGDRTIILLQKFDTEREIEHMFYEGDILGGVCSTLGDDPSRWIKIWDVASGKRCNRIELPMTNFFSNVRSTWCGLILFDKFDGIVLVTGRNLDWNEVRSTVQWLGISSK
jgi:hypothetical protein